ncbi:MULTISPECIES: HNH endonuclease signature motif containing protein [unclassified Roseovarius]|uniref:HNH endonuclease signature motif containing protein n=1 Tax=unclassified Roseovarius TaxID=2614913 RepID=UPI00273E6B49|nr:MULTISPECIES: HNH endonuclease signature motif containing protein [unclassified Roseovarius]
MKDAEYVQAVLSTEYATEHPHEMPYPNLTEVVRETSVDYLAGIVDGELPNGRKSREGHDYLWFKHGEKSILSHRFIAAITLGKWVPRDYDVDHVNHNPSDNRPINLRVVTPRDNAGNRRKALLSELADLETVSLELRVPEPKKAFGPEVTQVEIIDPPHLDASFDRGPSPQITFTGETKPAGDGLNWYKTNLGSWHLRRD